MFTYSKGHKRTGAGWEYSNTVEEQVDGETGHKATRQTRWSRVQEQSRAARRQRLVTQ